ncbi:hypothetical protein [Streptomyces lydicus]|uniref:hypothetical protein n=1 Tax=Streptomyces lydicus TaxID=47763 RepID=UPI001013974F|nr:hypothetical protein [Streptomyces lydicus]MCZ1012014.1 hypothetical protein [Streptomyces lydicus]
MAQTLTERRAAARAAAETDRQVARLYQVARRASSLSGLLTHPNTSAAGVALATLRIPRALSAAHRLLALPGVADHPETDYARSDLTIAESRLNAPSARLLLIADAARQAATIADAADDDLRVIVFRDIEQRCRHLVDTARVEPVLGRRGWTRHDHTANDRIQHYAAQWGLNSTPTKATGTALLTAVARPAGATYPPVPTHLARQAADRAATRAHCAPGIRCTECHRAYGARKVTLPGMWLCTDCIPAVNARLTARGYAPDTVQPVDDLPPNARYRVYLFNASGHGGRTIECDTPQRAQFLAETERPYNNTGYDISIHPTRPHS